MISSRIKFLVAILMLSTETYGLTKGKSVGGTEDINFDPSGEYKSGNSQDFPYVVSIEHFGINFCAGSIVRKNLVLTAAHCFVTLPRDTEFMSIHAGRLAAEGVLSPNSQVLKIKRVIIPISHNKTSVENDLALVQLEGNFTFTKYVDKVRLPKPNQKLPDFTRRAVSLGWGVTDSGLPSKVLMKLNSTILLESTCASRYDYYNVKMLCAAGDAGGSACSGDSGGPLVIHDYENPSNDLLVGVHTATKIVTNVEATVFQDCNSGHYVSANVAYFKNWINESIKRIKNDNDKNYNFVERW